MTYFLALEVVRGRGNIPLGDKESNECEAYAERRYLFCLLLGGA